jgi:hypothetical protein
MMTLMTSRVLTRLRTHALILLMLLASACATPGARLSGAAEDTPQMLYQRALATARYPTGARVSDTLLAIVPETAGLSWDKEGRVLAYTWTRSMFYSEPEYVRGYKFRLYSETWFTTGGEVHDVCSAGNLAGKHLDRRIEQLLGLPPDGTYDVFLAAWVNPAKLSRPCADRDITNTSCAISLPLKSSSSQAQWDCANVKTDQGQWLCNTWVGRYSNSDPMRQYPWTALGYTLDWSPDNATGIGVSEFVAPQDTEVVFERLSTTAEFCTGAAVPTAADQPQ